LILVMYAFGIYLDWSYFLIGGAIMAVLFQYSLFNHFSVRARIIGAGDTTSRIDEKICPIAQPWEKQKHVNFLHKIYLIGFSWQDEIINFVAGDGSEDLSFELTLSSLLGYGAQSLLILGLALTTNIELIYELVFQINGVIMLLVIFRSRF